MIDLHLLRSEPKRVAALINKKEPTFDVAALIKSDEQRRYLLNEVEQLRHKKNELADQVGRSGISDQLRGLSIEVGKKLKQAEKDLVMVQERFNALYLSCPNIPFEDVPPGNKEENMVVKTHGQKPNFTFSVKNHMELGQQLGWFDFDAAATMTGAQFALYKGEAVKLLYALTMFMLKYNGQNGYEYVLPPYLVNEKSLEIASNFPKFRDQVYAVPEDGLYLSPTAEVNLSNMYREHIFSESQLPKRMTSWTSCFRREAGGYGTQERGLIRLHEFEKVELYTICTPEQAQQEQERMLACAEGILQQLGLHYRVSLLASQDCSFPSAKTYDVEVWMPGQNAYYEVSSISNCTDFQARRGGIRYRSDEQKKPQLVYTLNGSSLALPRLMVALMETYQQQNGTIVIPEILQHCGIY